MNRRAALKALLAATAAPLSLQVSMGAGVRTFHVVTSNGVSGVGGSGSRLANHHTLLPKYRRQCREMSQVALNQAYARARDEHAARLRRARSELTSLQKALESKNTLEAEKAKRTFAALDTAFGLATLLFGVTGLAAGALVVPIWSVVGLGFYSYQVIRATDVDGSVSWLLWYKSDQADKLAQQALIAGSDVAPSAASIMKFASRAFSIAGAVLATNEFLRSNGAIERLEALHLAKDIAAREIAHLDALGSEVLATRDAFALQYYAALEAQAEAAAWLYAIAGVADQTGTRPVSSEIPFIGLSELGRSLKPLP